MLELFPGNPYWEPQLGSAQHLVLKTQYKLQLRAPNYIVLVCIITLIHVSTNIICFYWNYSSEEKCKIYPLTSVTLQYYAAFVIHSWLPVPFFPYSFWQTDQHLDPLEKKFKYCLQHYLSVISFMLYPYFKEQNFQECNRHKFDLEHQCDIMYL